MPEKFTAAFAKRLNGICSLTIKEARDKDPLIPGEALVAPGGRHLTMEKSSLHVCARVKDGPIINRHKPSVDVLFRSVAKNMRNKTLGIILTGMGNDGAMGLKELKLSGAETIAQNKASCVIFGMPREAIKLGSANQILGLEEIVEEINRFSKKIYG